MTKKYQMKQDMSFRKEARCCKMQIFKVFQLKMFLFFNQ